MLSLQQFINQYNGKYVDYGLFAGAKPGFVVKAMTCSVMYLQILYAIIKFIPINVVNYLNRRKIATQFSLHYKTMFSHILRRTFFALTERMVGGKNHNVTITNSPSASPSPSLFSGSRKLSETVTLHNPIIAGLLW